MSRTIYLILAVIVTLSIASATQGATILVDFGMTTQQTSMTGWNDIHGTPGGPGAVPVAIPYALNDSTGTPSGVNLTLSVAGNSGVAGTGANYTGTYPTEVASFPTNANQDSFYVGSSVSSLAGTVTATLSMLDQNSTYDFLIYGAAGNFGGTATWTATGLNSGNDTIVTTLNNSTEVAIINGIIPNASNEISIQMSNPTLELGRWNILQITQNAPAAELSIPEPATGSVLGLGALFVLRAARRRRTAANHTGSAAINA